MNAKAYPLYICADYQFSCFECYLFPWKWCSCMFFKNLAVKRRLINLILTLFLQAFCEEGNIQENGVLSFCKFVMFPVLELRKENKGFHPFLICLSFGICFLKYENLNIHICLGIFEISKFRWFQISQYCQMPFTNFRYASCYFWWQF